MRFRVLVSGGVYNDVDGVPVDIQVDRDDVALALVEAVRLLVQNFRTVELLFSEDGHKVASCELEVYQWQA